MPFATGGNARIRTNTPAENALNSLETSNKAISQGQLRLSTGKKINNASDDVAGYITSRALQARNGALKSALNLVGDALNLTGILQDALDNINGLITTIKDSTASASSGALGTDEKVALAKAAFRLTQQIQTVTDSTAFGGQQLLDGSFSVSFMIGTNARNSLLTLSVDMSTSNADFNISSNYFNANALTEGDFAGVRGLDMRQFNQVNANDLGIFSAGKIDTTLQSLATALNNVNKVASYLGGINNRMTSQEDLLKSQIVNYNAAVSRLEDADVAEEQLKLVRSQFLQQASLISLSQANQNPNSYLSLIKG
jgi:flagellin